MVGEQPPGFALVKSVGLLAVALALVTWIVPLASPATVAQISFPETTLNADTGVAPMSTLVTSGFVEVRSRDHEHAPCRAAGRRENDEMVGEARGRRGLKAKHDQRRQERDRRYAQPQVSFEESHGSLLTSRKRYSPTADPSARRSGRSPAGAPAASRPPRRERPVLLAVDQQLGEGAALRVRGLTRLARSREAIEGY
jgi:hypothetical protein